MVVAKRRLQDETDRDRTNVWLTAALTRGTKGLPKLDRFLTKRRMGPAQSVQQQRMALQMIFGPGRARPAQEKTHG